MPVTSAISFGFNLFSVRKRPSRVICARCFFDAIATYSRWRGRAGQAQMRVCEAGSHPLPVREDAPRVADGARLVSGEARGDGWAGSELRGHDRARRTE